MNLVYVVTFSRKKKDYRVGMKGRRRRTRWRMCRRQGKEEDGDEQDHGEEAENGDEEDGNE